MLSPAPSSEPHLRAFKMTYNATKKKRQRSWHQPSTNNCRQRRCEKLFHGEGIPYTHTCDEACATTAACASLAHMQCAVSSHDYLLLSCVGVLNVAATPCVSCSRHLTLGAYVPPVVLEYCMALYACETRNRTDSSLQLTRICLHKNNSCVKSDGPQAMQGQPVRRPQWVSYR